MESKLSISLVESLIPGKWIDGGEAFEFKPGSSGNLAGVCRVHLGEELERPYRIIELQSGIAMELGPESCIIEKMTADELQFWCGGRKHHVFRQKP